MPLPDVGTQALHRQFPIEPDVRADQCCRSDSHRGRLAVRPAAGAEDAFGEIDHRLLQAGLSHLAEGGFDVVLDAAELNAAVFDDGVGAAGVAVARLANAAGVEDLHGTEIDVEGEVGVADADEVGLDALQAGAPGAGIVGQVFVERVAGCAVNEEEGRSVEHDALGDGQLREILQMRAAEQVPVERARGGREILIAGARAGGDALGDGMVVVPADGSRGMLSDPLDAGEGIGAVIDEIAGEKAGVERLVDGGQGRPVGVNVGEHEDLHEVSIGKRTVEPSPFWMRLDGGGGPAI